MSVASSVRWYVKRAARSGVALGSRAAGACEGSDAAIRVLTYHGVGNVPRAPFFVKPDAFARQMAHLAERKLALSLSDLEAFLQRASSAPRGAVLVTIDDGLRSLHREALPILRDFGIPAVAFVTPDWIGEGAQLAGAPESSLTWGELAEVRAGGIEIGSHGLTHRSLGEMPPSEAEDEARRSRDLLEERLGTCVRALAYPYGGWPDFTPATRDVLSHVGYQYGFTSQHGAVQHTSDPLELPRIKVEGGDSMALFRQLPLGAMDRWRIVDRTLWRLQARP